VRHNLAKVPNLRKVLSVLSQISHPD